MRDIALCQSFRTLAGWTSRKLRDAHKYDMAFNEETITESLLLKLAIRHQSKNFRIRSWNKAEEGKGTAKTGGKPTGADWDFCFLDAKGKGVTVRVQAKRMYRTGRYDALNVGGKQIANLIANCGSTIPLYVFYNDVDLFDFQSTFGAPCSTRFRGNSMWGCTYSPITAIPRKSKSSPAPSEISKMQPWHCLIYPCGYDGTASYSLPELVAGAIERAYKSQPPSEVMLPKEIFKFDFDPHQDAPEWATCLMHSEDTEETDEILTKYVNENGLRGVALIQQLNDQEKV